MGAPTKTTFNGLGMIADTLHHMPKHAVAATWGTLPTALASTTMPTISDIAVLNRRDALIVYVPAVAGAADYRAYIYDSTKVTFAGTQPRGAVIACAGTRQRFELNVDADLSGTLQFYPIQHREVIQAIEVPGLVANGSYQVVVEALATPCPFPGVMGHDDANVSLTFQNLGVSFPIRSFNTVMSMYGNEIINGQGSTLTDYKNANATTQMPVETVGVPVSPTSTTIPSDPVVLARSAIVVTRPAADESVNAPVIDVGPNSIEDNFSTDAIMTAFHAGTRDTGAGLTSEGPFGNWYFWMVGVQPALTDNSSGVNPLGAQVWQRHGRLYTTFGDDGQDIMGSVYFSSMATTPHPLDPTLYVHSMFRVNSQATQRRYWHWFMCGGATPGELADPTTNIPRGRPAGQPHFYNTGGPTNSILGYNVSGPLDGEASTPYQLKECLNIIQLGNAWNWGPKPSKTSTWFDQPHSELHAFIDPAGVTNGIINLKPAGIPDDDTGATGGMLWRLDANKQATEPMFEPFDQEAPLTHFDVFVRPDRVIFYINGRQSWCGDLSGRPLTMKYGEITYGSVLYHTAAEIQTDYVGQAAYIGAEGGSTHYVMNTPWADTRVWDVVGESEKVAIPSQFTFDPTLCFKPNSTAVQ